MQKVSRYTKDHNNNFNALRLIAASAVLVSHSFPLATGNQQIEPFVREVGLTLGTMAVHIFFVTSGFLVTGSLLSRRSVVDFCVARALRIYPALWLSQLVTVLVVGLWFTSLDSRVFFTEWHTWHSVIRNCVLLRGVDLELPGAFLTVPFAAGGVNSSLWTLPVELGMYIRLAIFWLILAYIPKWGGRLFGTFIALLAVSSIALSVAGTIAPLPQPLRISFGWVLTGMFFCGAALRLFQERVPISHRLASILAAVLLVSLVDREAFRIIYLMVVPYLVIYAGLGLSVRGRRMVLRSDYSYGIYIYAYPIQQSIAATMRGITPLAMIALAYPVTLGFGAASWHLLEKRALKLKRSFGALRLARKGRPMSPMPGA
jgi:peptidoglycan/LPS O-acetylase OafA/YrhL